MITGDGSYIYTASLNSGIQVFKQTNGILEYVDGSEESLSYPMNCIDANGNTVMAGGGYETTLSDIPGYTGGILKTFGVSTGMGTSESVSTVTDDEINVSGIITSESTSIDPNGPYTKQSTMIGGKYYYTLNNIPTGSSYIKWNVYLKRWEIHIIHGGYDSPASLAYVNYKITAEYPPVEGWQGWFPWDSNYTGTVALDDVS